MLQRIPAARPIQEEDKKMATASNAARTPGPLSIVVQTCTKCGAALAWNNRSGRCSKCQEPRSHKKKNGVEHQPAKEDVITLAAPGNGNGAHPAPLEIRVQSLAPSARVDLLFAAIPIDDKRKLVCAYLAGTL